MMRLNETSQEIFEKGLKILLAGGLLLTLAACGPTRIPSDSKGHIHLEKPSSADTHAPAIPEPVTQVPLLPKPSAQPKQDTYTVVVSDVPIKELLFALARDAQVNLDIYDDISGNITINAIDQSLPQILDRIAKQSNIRYMIEGKHLTVAADTPFLRSYALEYVNLSRNGIGQIDLSTQISATGSGNISGGGGSGSGSNNSYLSVMNTNEHHFWESMFINIASILGKRLDNPETIKRLADENLVVNREAGLINVRATSRQHEEIQRLIDNVMESVKRQVLIEATVVEVVLNNSYQSGVDWARLGRGGADLAGLNYQQNLLGNNINEPPSFVLDYKDPSSSQGDLSVNIRMLEEFGDVKVLSSPKILALNNQTAILKVVDNRVYFTIEIDTTATQGVVQSNAETTIHTVPVGLVIGITPFVGNNGQIILNVRPTISRILRFVKDPNPALATANVENLIPEIQVREMESVLQLNDNQIAMIGGLMQNRIDKDVDAVPLIHRIPIIGNAFKYRNDQYNKTELVIFLKALIVRNPSLEADLKHMKTFLPESKPR